MLISSLRAYRRSLLGDLSGAGTLVRLLEAFGAVGLVDLCLDAISLGAGGSGLVSFGAFILGLNGDDGHAFFAFHLEAFLAYVRGISGVGLIAVTLLVLLAVALEGGINTFLEGHGLDEDLGGALAVTI